MRIRNKILRKKLRKSQSTISNNKLKEKISITGNNKKYQEKYYNVIGSNQKAKETYNFF